MDSTQSTLLRRHGPRAQLWHMSFVEPCQVFGGGHGGHGVGFGGGHGGHGVGFGGGHGGFGGFGGHSTGGASHAGSGYCPLPPLAARAAFDRADPWDATGNARDRRDHSGDERAEAGPARPRARRSRSGPLAAPVGRARAAGPRRAAPEVHGARRTRTAAATAAVAAVATVAGTALWACAPQGVATAVGLGLAGSGGGALVAAAALWLGTHSTQHAPAAAAAGALLGGAALLTLPGPIVAMGLAGVVGITLCGAQATARAEPTVDA